MVFSYRTVTFSTYQIAETRTKMHSTWMNGQHEQIGPASQAMTQLTYDTMRNQQAGSANNLCQYRTGGQLLQRANFIFHDGSNRQKQTIWQTSQAPQQTVSFPQPAGGNNKNHYVRFLQNSTANTQTGNPCLPFSTGFQATTQQQCFQHSSALNSSTQMPPGIMKANTTYPQQDMSLCWTQPVHGKQSIRVQNGNIVSDLQNYSVQKTVHQSVNREAMKPLSAHTTKATSLLHEQEVCTSSLVSATAHNRQTVYNQYPRQNHTQHRLSSSFPTSYSAAVLQSFRNNGNTNRHFHVSSTSQKTQQYAPRINTIHYNGGEATSTGNSHSRQREINHFPLKVNETPLKYNAEIARIVDSLQKSYTAQSDNHRPFNTCSPNIRQQLVSEVRLTASNQPAQPGSSTLAQAYNSNTTQLLPLHRGQSLSKTTQNVMSEVQHFRNTPPQQSSVGDGSSLTTTGDRSGNGNKADSAPHEASLLRQMLESISPQEIKTQSPVKNIHEILEKLPSVKQSDSSFHSSPGRTGTRAVAVVQPLSQESIQVASEPNSYNTSSQLGECTTAYASLSNPDKLCISPDVEKNKKAACLSGGFNVCTENANQNLTKHSAASSDGTVVSSSSSSEPQDLSLQQLCTDDTGCEMAINMQADKGIATTAQQSVTSEVPVSQNSEMTTEQKLSLIPTTPWTRVMLTNLIRDKEKAQMQVDVAKFDSANKLLRKFWDDNCKLLKQDWYKDLITKVQEFCDKHVTTDSTVLTQVKHDFGKVLKQYHVLKDKEVHSEPLYKSSWLNVNEQLDDIDKEFGFPWSQKHRLKTFETGNQPDQDSAVNSDPAQIVSEVPSDLSSKTELESVGSGEEKQASTLVTTSTKTLSTNKAETADSSDPYYSFEIQVLPPEEAKVIFEQIQSKMPQSMDVDSQPEEVMDSSVEGNLHEVKDVTLEESKLENKSVSLIEQVCCITRWMELVSGPKMSSWSKCQCKKEQCHIDCIDKIPDVEETAAEKKDKQCSRKSDTKLHSAIKEDNQVNGGNNINMTFSCPEICNELSHTIALTEDDNKPHLYFDKESNIYQINLNDSQSSVIIISDNENEEIKSAESNPSRHSDNSEKEIKKIFSSEVPSQMSDPEDDCAQAELTSTDVTKSSLESHEEKTQVSVTPALKTTFKLGGKCGTVKRKRKTLSSDNIIFPKAKKSKKCKVSVDLESQPVFKGVKYKKDLVDAPDRVSPAANVKTVELALFGTARQGKCTLIGSRKSHISFPKSSYIAALVPPKVLTVNVSPLRGKANVPAEPCSLKHRIYEKWRSSFPPTKIRQRSKLKTPKSTFASLSGVSLKKAETARPTNFTELPVSSEIRSWSKNTKRSLSLKRRKSHSNGEDKTNRVVVTFKLPADEERSDADSGSCAVMSLQENNGLKFSVLPNNFKFKFGSSGGEETTCPVSGRSYY